MTELHLIAALVSLAATMLYADRSAHLYQVGGTQTGWALVTRVGVGIWMTTVVGAFINLAAIGAPFEWRHLAVFAAMLLVIVGHLGMRLTSAPPT